ncbi:hypothetical protein LY78DRAFT_537665, partial [Colletotrichum sublineola]
AGSTVPFSTSKQQLDFDTLPRHCGGDVLKHSYGWRVSDELCRVSDGPPAPPPESRDGCRRRLWM